MAPRLLAACFGRGSSSSSSKTTQSPAEGSAAVGVEEQQDERRRRKEGVVVELFSSQGCATSPAAEALVSRLGRGDFEEEEEMEVVVMAFHVDYWDHMGWKDPWGSSQWTVRQKAYAEALGADTLFTPQIVIQGRSHCLGTDHDALFASIHSAPRFPAPSFQATFQKPSPDTLQVSVTGALGTKVDGHGVNVMVALYESGLVTDCPKGENKGRVLSNDFVVRRLDKLCSLKDISAKKTVTGSVTFGLWDGFNSTKCGVAVFVENASHQMFGSLRLQLPNSL